MVHVRSGGIFGFNRRTEQCGPDDSSCNQGDGAQNPLSPDQSTARCDIRPCHPQYQCEIMIEAVKVGTTHTV